jgi:hypothetical protein
MAFNYEADERAGQLEFLALLLGETRSKGSSRRSRLELDCNFMGIICTGIAQTVTLARTLLHRAR